MQADSGGVGALGSPPSPSHPSFPLWDFYPTHPSTFPETTWNEAKAQQQRQSQHRSFAYLTGLGTKRKPNNNKTSKQHLSFAYLISNIY